MGARRNTTFDFTFDWESPNPFAKQPSRPLKYLPPGGGVVEITTRTLHGRMLIKPGTSANGIVRGVLGRALFLFPKVRLFGYWFLSNHFNLLAHFPNVYVMGAFMNHVNGCLGRELGKLHDWPERVFGRRYRGIVLADAQAQVARLAYLLAQGTKENLVARPDQWPGVNCLRALLEGTPDRGQWLDRTALYRARRRNPKARAKDFVTEYEIPLHPLPCWGDLSVEDRKERVVEIVRQIEEAARETNARLRRKPLGAARILRQDPHARPDKIAKSPAPLCHASSRKSFWRFANAYRTWVKAYRAASRALRGGDLAALERFPAQCFLPGIGPPAAIAPV